MEGKSELDYKKIFEFIKSKWSCLNPDTIICDYETALHKSLKQVFGSLVQGCYFHYSQVIFFFSLNLYILNYEIVMGDTTRYVLKF